MDRRSAVRWTHPGKTRCLRYCSMWLCQLWECVSSSVGVWAACACSALKQLCHGSIRQKGSSAEIMSCPSLQFRMFSPASSSNSLSDDSILLLLQPQNAPVAFLRYSVFVIAFCLRQLKVESNSFTLLSRRWWFLVSLLTRQASHNVRQCCGVSQPPERSSQEAPLPAACWLLGPAWTPCPDCPCWAGGPCT